MKFARILMKVSTIVFLSNFALASLIYIPPKVNLASAKMIVVIHGCLQSAESMALGTGWNQIAAANNLVILYPQVPEGSNPLGCWTWYLPENQGPTSGQLKMVVDEINSVRKTFKLRLKETYVTGISSGAAVASGLLACFPKMFKAGAIHSGPSYAIAQTLEDADRVLKEGPPLKSLRAPCRPRDFDGSVMVIQGGRDAVVNPLNAPRIMEDFIGNSNAVSTKEFKDGESSYVLSNYKSAGTARGRLVMVSELGHAWSGFANNLRQSNLLGPDGQIPTQIPFFSKIGPSATNLIWDFFVEASGKSMSQDSEKGTSSK